MHAGVCPSVSLSSHVQVVHRVTTAQLCRLRAVFVGRRNELYSSSALGADVAPALTCALGDKLICQQRAIWFTKPPTGRSSTYGRGGTNGSPVQCILGDLGSVAYLEGGFGVFKPPQNSEDIGGVLDHTSKKNQRLDFLLQFTVFSYGCNLLNKGFF